MTAPALARLSLRIRVTLAIAAAMAALLAALSAFLVLRLASQLDLAVREGLESRAADLAALVQSTPAPPAASPPRPLADEDASTAQVLDARGRVIAATPASRARPLLPATELARARRRPLLVDRRLGREETPVRLLATAAGARGAVVVVGQSLETRDEAVRQLEGQLAIGVPVALLLASVLGYAATATALRPVRTMTRRARDIGAAGPGERLPVPPTRDEIAELGTTLNALLDRLDEALRRERAFVADASHELRTPLAIVSAEIDVALRTATTTAEHREALEMLATQNARVVRLAEDLLVLARADQHRLPVRPEPLDLGDALAGCGERFAARAAGAGLRLRWHAAPQLLVAADEIRLDQLLDNLVENALRYARTTIALEARRDAGEIAITVADDGPGFPPAFVERAFDRFAMADDARAGGHAGLGLAIVEAIARVHGWRVTLPPTRNGACVELRLPPLAPPG